MRNLLACLVILFSGPAFGLSCMRPDAVRLFEQARDAEAAFYIVIGRVQLLKAANQPQPGSKDPARTRARITGQALSSSGFNAPFDREVTVEVSCLSAWCGSVDNLRGDLLMAVEIGLDTLTLSVGPCGGDQMVWEQAAEDRLLKCHLEGICEPAEF